MTPIIDERATKLDTITLKRGAHKNAAAGLCVMECVAFIAGEP